MESTEAPSFATSCAIERSVLVVVKIFIFALACDTNRNEKKETIKIFIMNSSVSMSRMGADTDIKLCAQTMLQFLTFRLGGIILNAYRTEFRRNKSDESRSFF